MAADPGQRLKRLWMRSMWKRLGDNETTTEENPPENLAELTLVGFRAGRVEPVVLSVQKLSTREVDFRTHDPILEGEELTLRFSLPGLRLELTAQVLSLQNGLGCAQLLTTPAQLQELSRILALLSHAA